MYCLRIPAVAGMTFVTLRLVAAMNQRQVITGSSHLVEQAEVVSV
jgi:hypothetical protein